MADDDGGDLIHVQFRDGVSEPDIQTHFDLGVAYAEMGLHLDAISEFEIVTRAAPPESPLQGRAGDAIRACKVELGEASGEPDPEPPDIVA